VTITVFYIGTILWLPFSEQPHLIRNHRLDRLWFPAAH